MLRILCALPIAHILISPGTLLADRWQLITCDDLDQVWTAGDTISRSQNSVYVDTFGIWNVGNATDSDITHALAGLAQTDIQNALIALWMNASEMPEVSDLRIQV